MSFVERHLGHFNGITVEHASLPAALEAES
jgi:hypothetical protein